MRFLLALALAATAGCVVHDHPWHPHGGPPGHWRVVVVETGHICTFHCDHFYTDGIWYVIDGHHHGPDCGHYHVDGRWGHMKPPPGQVKKIEEHRDVKVQERGPEHRDVHVEERAPERKEPKKEAGPQDKGPKKEPKKDKDPKDDDEDKGPKKDKEPKGKK